MGCRHSSSSSPPSSPKLMKKKGGLKTKIFHHHHHSKKFHSQKSNGIKSVSLNLEQILDGHSEHLIKRFEFNFACLLYDISSTHILLLNHRQLELIHINTMNIQTYFISIENFDIQEIVWSTQLNLFLILTTDQLYQTNIDQLELKPIQQIQFIHEGHRKSYMTVNGDDLVINRSFGYDLHRYSLSNFHLIQSSSVYKNQKDFCITTIRLNSKKILALAISIHDKQMIDLMNINTNEILHRIQLDLNENILYPIDLHFNGLWFAKTCIPNVNIGHCLISSDGQMKRLKLFTNQDNFIRSFRLNYEKKWLVIGRQHALELYSLTNSMFLS